MSFQRKCWNVRTRSLDDRVARVDLHAELAGEDAEAERVVGPPPTVPLLLRSKPDGMPVFDGAE